MRQHKQYNAKTLWGGGNFLASIFACSNTVGINHAGARY